MQQIHLFSHSDTDIVIYCDTLGVVVLPVLTTPQ